MFCFFSFRFSVLINVLKAKSERSGVTRAGLKPSLCDLPHHLSKSKTYVGNKSKKNSKRELTSQLPFTIHKRKNR